MLGKYKVLFDRAKSYAGAFNTLMIGYLFFKETGFQWWYLLIIIIFGFWLYIDQKYILGKERDYIWTRNGKVNDMLDNIKYIREKIDGHTSKKV